MRTLQVRLEKNWSPLNPRHCVARELSEGETPPAELMDQDGDRYFLYNTERRPVGDDLIRVALYEPLTPP
jgi:hypothetical protein